MKKIKSGKLELSSVKPEVHEYVSYLFLVKTGKNIKLLPPSNKYKVHSADFEMDGLLWELKCPQGKGKYVIRDTLKQASSQADYLAIDLARLKLNQEKALRQIRKYFPLNKKLKRILIITKEHKIIDIHK